MNYYTMELVGRERLEALWAEADRRSQVEAGFPPSAGRRRLHPALFRIGSRVIACARSLAAW
jgi:hypothetical protein